ncbi:hypothetical protein FQA39_LY12049 [Lamprigera yunnana]|nr:hypothetical protein FQA39_LY12049 [Lamprigera yunnana]
MDESISSSPKNETFCKVCGDKASGKHYGVSSCDGCRGFFKRSIRRNLEYVCKENGRCIVDVTRRNQCQACRFKKCLQVNMKRDAVQHERAPRATQTGLHHHYPLNLGPRLRNCHGSSFFSGIPLHVQTPSMIEHNLSVIPGLSTNYLHHGILFPGMFGGYNKHGLFSTSSASSNLHYGHKQESILLSDNLHMKHLRNNVKDDEVTSTEEASVKCDVEERHHPSARNRLELPILGETCRSGSRILESSCLSVFPAENVYESAAKLLFLSVKWAKTVPSFLQLSYRDQSILLEESWSELFILTAAQWTLPIDEALLVNNAITPTSRHIALEEDARKLHEIIARLNNLRVDHTEHACLKALVLFKAECRGLCEPNHIEVLQDQTHVMLHEYCTQKYSSYKGRFGKLLLALPAIQAISRMGLKELLFRQVDGDAGIERLLGEIAKMTHT